MCVWDLDSSLVAADAAEPGPAPAAPGKIQPTHRIRAHKGAVEEVGWIVGVESALCTAGRDGYLFLWDLRALPRSGGPAGSRLPGAVSLTPALAAQAPETPALTALATNLHQPYLVLGGAEDAKVYAWDLRNVSRPFHEFVSHRGPIYAVESSPFHETVFLSTSADRRVHVWDMARVGCDQEVEQADDAPPELLFIHGGHIAPVWSASWSPNIPWTVASVAENNVLMFWQMAESIYNQSGTGLRPA